MNFYLSNLLAKSLEEVWTGPRLYLQNTFFYEELTEKKGLEDLEATVLEIERESRGSLGEMNSLRLFETLTGFQKVTRWTEELKKVCNTSPSSCVTPVHTHCFHSAPRGASKLHIPPRLTQSSSSTNSLSQFMSHRGPIGSCLWWTSGIIKSSISILFTPTQGRSRTPTSR